MGLDLKEKVSDVCASDNLTGQALHLQRTLYGNFAKWVDFPIGRVEPGRVCACSLGSKLVYETSARQENITTLVREGYNYKS